MNLQLIANEEDQDRRVGHISLTAFDETIALALDSKSTLYVLDDIEHRVRKIQ